MKLIAYGAEAKIYKTKIFNKNVIVKQRLSKKYRHKLLDKKIIKRRNKEEANLLKKIKNYNINCPTVYYVGTNKIIMNYIQNENTHKHKLLEIGKEISKLHNNGIIHGDLNLINIIVNKNKVYFIDFGLGSVSQKIEDKATDLLVFKKTLLSQKKTEHFWGKILEGYSKNTTKKEIINQIGIIEKRGRYL